MIADHPLPTTDDPIDAAFWQGAREGKLLVQVCGDCGLARHPPRPMCPACRSVSTEWRETKGTGRLWSWVAPRPPLLPAFEALLPYVTAAVELDGYPGVRLIGPLLNAQTGGMQDVDPSGLRIGDHLQVAFVNLSADVAFPGWRPAD